MRQRLLIIGAGGHGSVAADCAAEVGQFGEVEFLDDSWPNVRSHDGWAVIGRSSDLGRLVQEQDHVFIALGRARDRERLAADVQVLGLQLATLVHPRAAVSQRAKVARGCFVAAGAVINIGAFVAECAIVNTGATVDHHCELAAFVHVCPGAHLGGGVRVGMRSWLGIGCSVKHGVSIGEDVTIGAGAAVITDVANGATVVGVPARVRGDLDRG